MDAEKPIRLERAGGADNMGFCEWCTIGNVF